MARLLANWPFICARRAAFDRDMKRVFPFPAQSLGRERAGTPGKDQPAPSGVNAAGGGCESISRAKVGPGAPHSEGPR